LQVAEAVLAALVVFIMQVAVVLAAYCQTHFLPHLV
jgi:hypothetical protein